MFVSNLVQGYNSGFVFYCLFTTEYKKRQAHM